MNEHFNALSPFEKTVLLEIARLQAYASAIFQVTVANNKAEIPPFRDILAKALEDSKIGIAESLKQNQ